VIQAQIILNILLTLALLTIWNHIRFKLTATNLLKALTHVRWTDHKEGISHQLNWPPCDPQRETFRSVNGDQIHFCQYNYTNLIISEIYIVKSSHGIQINREWCTWCWVDSRFSFPKQNWMAWVINQESSTNLRQLLLNSQIIYSGKRTGFHLNKIHFTSTMQLWFS